MATETVTQGPKAFEGWDSSIFMGWLNAMSDMLLTGGDSCQMADRTLQEYGGLMHQLGVAANELQASERAEWKARS